MASTSSIRPNDSISVVSVMSDGPETNTLAASTNTSSYRIVKNKKAPHPVWRHCRKAGRGEPRVKASGKTTRAVWYCKHAGCEDYSTLSTITAQNHLASFHDEQCGQPPLSRTAHKIQSDIESFTTPVEVARRARDDALVQNALKTAANPVTVGQAILRLIVYHDLPLSFVEWPETHTLINAINYQAGGCIWTSHQTTAYRVSTTFRLRQQQLRRQLQQSLSLVHITSDTWHSPNNKEFQSITAHFVDNDGKLQKALLGLPELAAGHSGVEVAPYVLRALEWYQIKERVGYVTTDNATANDTLCMALGDQLNDWQPVERRLRCIGHIINLAVQSFWFATSQEAAELASQDLSMDNEIDALDGEGGWIQQPALQKILHFVTTLRRSDRLFNDFKRLAGKAIRKPVITRWNSYYSTFEDALELRVAYTTFVLDNEQLIDYELSAVDWQLVEQTITFLQPFKQATKQCEGDYVTLDKVQIHMDVLRSHFIKERAKWTAARDKAFLEAIVTSWYAFDKYYSWIDQTGAYSAAILLNPTLKKGYLAAAWQRDWVKPGIERARAIWLARYKKEVTATQPTDVTNTTKALTAYDEFMSTVMAKQSSRRGATTDEFDRFIDGPAEAIQGSPLLWWCQPQQRLSYPQLSSMAIDVLSAPAMSAEDERVFSGTRRTISWTRARLSASLIERLECLKH
jgi:hypothetical protein